VVDAPPRLAVCKGEEVRAAALQEELERNASEEVAARHELPQHRQAPHARPRRRAALPLAVAHPAGEASLVDRLAPFRRRGRDLVRVRITVGASGRVGLRIRVRLRVRLSVSVRVRGSICAAGYQVRYEAQRRRTQLESTRLRTQPTHQSSAHL
jgi:hypothetical protein